MPKTTTTAFLLTFTLLGAAFTWPANAAPSSYDEDTRILVMPCVEPTVNGSPSLKNGQPKTHTVTLQLDASLQIATAVSASKVEKTEDCLATFELTTGIVNDQILYQDETVDVSFKYTSGFSFAVTSFPGAGSFVAEPAQTSLWRVSSGGNDVFVAGGLYYSDAEFFTVVFGIPGIDILRPEDMPLPSAFQEVYEASDALVTLTSPAQLNAALLTMNGLIQNGRGPLVNFLDDDLYQELSDYLLETFNIEVQGLNPLRPHWMADLLGILSLTVSGYTAGLETHFQELASNEDKINWGLEEADQLMRVTNLNMLDADPNALVSEALARVKDENFLANVNALLDAWRTGDDDYIEKALTDPDKLDLADYTRLYTDRHAVWLNAFIDMLESSEVEMVIVDVKHLVGADGFLALLEAEGYTVERY